MRVTTAAPRSDGGASALVSESRAMSASASAFICAIDRCLGHGRIGRDAVVLGASSTDSVPNGRRASRARCSSAPTSVSTASLIGAPEAGSNAPRRQIMPDASSQMAQGSTSAQLVFAGPHAVGVEVRLELLGEARDSVDAHDGRTVDEELLGGFHGIGLHPYRDAVEEPSDEVCAVDADRARMERGGEMRMPRRQRRPGEARSAGRWPRRRTPDARHP